MTDEAARLRALNALRLLDTPAEPRFDRLTSLAAHLFDAPMVALSLLHGERLWFKSRIGLKIEELPLRESVCNITRTLPDGACLVAPDLSLDPRFASLPITRGRRGARFYAGSPIRLPSGAAVGALAVLDHKPRPRPPEALLQQLASLAQIAATELEFDLVRAAAEERERLLRLAEQMTGAGRWRLDLQTGEVMISEGVFRIYGMEPQESEVRQLAETQLIPSDAISEIERLLTAAAVDGTPFTHHSTITLPDGRLRRLESMGAPDIGGDGRRIGVSGVLRDITEEVERVEALKLQMARYRLLTDHAQDVIVSLSPDGMIDYCSPAVTQMTGFLPEELVGRASTRFLVREDIPLAAAALETTRRTGRSTRVECRFRRKSGGAVWVEALLAPIHDPQTGELAGYCDVIRDITERRQLEDSLREATVVAERAVKVKSEFMANMTHELRTPLTSILGFGALLANAADLTPESRRYVSRVMAASGSLLTTVNDILDFSRLEAGQVEIRRRPVDVAALIRDTADLLRPQAEEKDLSLQVSVADGTPALAVDPDRLRQVLLNLIGNAVKFTHAGGVAVSAHYDAERRRLSCSVEDTGPGIPADQLQSIFQRFVRALDGSDTGPEGSGLGLAIASGLLRLMDGAVDVASTVGVGSRFEFVIAADPARLDPASDAPDRDAPALRVLVVDDHAANRDLVRVILAPLGWDVEEAENGETALERCAFEAYDVILMDYRMPGLTGLEALQAIRRRPGPNQTVPIIAFTANASGEDARRLLKQGFDGFAGKPILPADLLAAIIDTVNAAASHRKVFG